MPILPDVFGLLFLSVLQLASKESSDSNTTTAALLLLLMLVISDRLADGAT